MAKKIEEKNNEIKVISDSHHFHQWPQQEEQLSESEQSDILVKKKNLENLHSKKKKQITNDKL